ncbi:MAG TPA: helix-turn-helix domain-containing protein [Actinophytocola sp.]|uniref:helix-turn-helix domain-containing protein n=1 Tax=Actinophytocola sp. TaxID=1872138 RepID=UPI002DDD4B9A|nr:helix-turn-helix domain-containing protein [Actinophytocola sp.]HEV2778464.1 helix-turn-helix domain-containing protein [Actinophytocola sp.]
MAEQWYSVEQVADLLGLHVKTVRNYVRDGRLKAVRIGKQYRISRADLEALTGGPVAEPEPVRRQRRVEVTSIVLIDAIDPNTMSRLSTLLLGSANSRPEDDERLRVETTYDEERGSMKIIIIGGPDSSAELLRLVNVVLESK